MVEQTAFNIEEYNAAQQFALEQSFKQMSEGVAIMCDIDETIVDTVGKHSEVINRGAAMLGFKNGLPSREELLTKGGTAVYSEIFGISPEEWEEKMERIRDSKYINAGATIYHPEVANIIASLQDTKLLGFLTAKPGTERTLQVTQEDLFKRIGLPRSPIILRPSTIHISETSAWKVRILNQIAQQDPDKKLVLIDDSISTAKALIKHNSQHTENPIIQILYKGPLTKPLLESKAFIPNVSEGIYSSDWDEVPQIIDQIQHNGKS